MMMKLFNLSFELILKIINLPEKNANCGMPYD